MKTDVKKSEKLKINSRIYILTISGSSQIENYLKFLRKIKKTQKYIFNFSESSQIGKCLKKFNIYIYIMHLRVFSNRKPV